MYECVSVFKNWEQDKEELALTVWSYIRAANPGISEKLLKKVERKAINDGIFPEGGSMNVRDLIRQEGWQEGIQEGIQEGKKKGIQEGLEKGIQEVASNMFQNNLDISLISKVTGLSQKEIKKLKNKT